MKRHLYIFLLVILLSENNLVAQIHLNIETPKINSEITISDKDTSEFVIVRDVTEEFTEIKSDEDVQKIIDKLAINHNNLTAQGAALSKTLKFYKDYELEYQDILPLLNNPEIIDDIQNHVEKFNATKEVIKFYTSIHTSDKTAYVDFKNMFYEYPFEENSFRYKYFGPKEYIPNPLILKDGSSIKINFKTTDCDKSNANQLVADILIETIKESLLNANINLRKLGYEPIKSITVTCTTNGHCSPKQRQSNHHSGTAIDISAINGISISYKAKRKTRRYIFEIQNAFNLHKYIRECFGPSFNDKTNFTDGRTTSMIDRYEKIVVPHYNHLHIAVRAE
ncbi:hypothetical protein [uncultured Zobellia sp.]|uniref:hypothetical protein n=1 Tax=uncultured Zobellia sp. TaxID=255433 RepID=UPI0025975C5B|nr:hypothetical protein [uncultured Zobellia sp.]